MIERGVIIVSNSEAIDLKDLFPCLNMSQDTLAYVIDNRHFNSTASHTPCVDYL
jgi:hypothetical protein